jgi:hypothetical protein
VLYYLKTILSTGNKGLNVGNDKETFYIGIGGICESLDLSRHDIYNVLDTKLSFLKELSEENEQGYKLWPESILKDKRLLSWAKDLKERRTQRAINILNPKPVTKGYREVKRR